MNRITIIGVMFLLVSTSFSVTSVAGEDPIATMSNGNTLYVGGTGPGNYSKIQDAINSAFHGDTVFVYNGTYYERIVINKRISLIGEDRDTTVIDGSGVTDYIVYISANWVNISGFTIQRISLQGWCTSVEIRASYVTIKGNILRKNKQGIRLTSKNNKVFNNIISQNTRGISFEGRYQSVYENIISNNSVAISMLGSYTEIDSCVISMNQICDNEVGFEISNTKNTTISFNNIINNNRNTRIKKENTFFLSLLKEEILNLPNYEINWDSNYWDRPRVLPKTIIGINIVNIWVIMDLVIPIAIHPYLQFDMHPAKVPYTINV